ncbi:MAG: FG-GAP-like repeat-containing protein, partial [Candidatus Poseidoniaceae archaeon]
MKAQFRAVLMLLILVASTILVPVPTSADGDDDDAWDPVSQPWAQYGRDPGHSRLLPEHGDSGLMTIETPAINWEAFDTGNGADGYGVAIANLSNSITSPEGAKERCGENHLFAVLTHTENVDERHLSIIEGNTAKVAWQVNLGSVDVIRSTPIIVDVDGDSKQEIAIVYDSGSALEVDLWAPEITCDESGWSVSGHSNEKLWSWSDADLRIGIENAHFWTSPESVTQPLLADLSLDGAPELIIAAVDTTTDEPTVVALPLGLQTPEEDWKVALDRGTHPSDPAFAALDDNSGSIVLTTVDENSGNFWIWRIDGPTGSLDWERVSIQGTDSDSNTPRIRLPGPVITQLDSDAAPEMILTLPSDENQDEDGMGAQYIGMELTSTDEIWRFRAKNGYADAEPLAVDTTGNGITDRVCWVTWYSTGVGTTDRDGLAGCHDITIDPPFREWSRVLQSGSGNDNEGEVAISSPIAIDLDGEDELELLVAYGKRIFAFDGNTGTSADIGVGWSSPIDIPHRTWAAPAVADLDGDGYLDILVGDTLISEAKSDIAPLADGRGIGFTPTDPDPGEMVTISGQYSNIGIVDTDEAVDAVLMMNGIEIERSRVNIAEATAPSGEGGPITFSVDIEATLGVHTVELLLDVNNNLTQTRYDNDNFSTTLVVLEPYVAQLQTPVEVSRALPGTSQIVDVTVTSLGSRNAAWTLNYDSSQLPDGWTFNPVNANDLSLNLERNTPQIVQFEFSVPQGAVGSDDAQIPLSLVLDQDQNITSFVTLPLEVERTRGLSLQGPTGLPMGIGYGRPGDVAHV